MLPPSSDPRPVWDSSWVSGLEPSTPIPKFPRQEMKAWGLGLGSYCLGSLFLQ